MLLTADYSNPGRAQLLPNSPNAGAFSVSLEIPPPIRSRLLAIPAWQWILGLLGLIWTLVYVDKWMVARRRQRNFLAREPGLRARSHPRSELTPTERLVLACGGDREKARRLQAFEVSRTPGLTAEEAAQRAWDRLQYDRGRSA